MKALRVVAAVATAAPLVVGGALDPAHAQVGVEASILTCSSVPGTKRNLLIHSTQQVTCVFESADGSTGRYRSETGIGFGIDFQLESDETLAYTVLSGTSDRSKPTLAGRYVGAEASVEAGVGGTAAVLIGGGDGSLTLQPLALGVRTGGAGVSAGIGYLYLEPQP